MVSKRQKDRHLDFKKASIFLKDCASIGVKTINVEGGEINLYPRIREFFALAKFLRFRLACYSHLDFDSDAITYLRAADLIRVNLSAVDRTSYRQIHGKDGFDNVVRNLILLRNSKAVKGSPRVVLSFVITQLNYRLVAPFLSLAKALQVDRVRFKLHSATREMISLIPTYEAFTELKNDIKVILRQRSAVRNNLVDIQRIISSKAFFTEKRSFEWNKYHNDRFFYYYSLKKRKTRCFVGWFYSMIDECGRVIAPCDNVGICVPGNILNESFKDIWFHSLKYAAVRQECLSGMDILTPKWQECRYCGYADFNDSVACFLRKSNSGNLKRSI